MTGNLIQQLGARYFRERYMGKLLVVGDLLLATTDCTEDTVGCMAMASRTDPEVNRKYRNGVAQRVEVGAGVFTSFDIFSYPRMGYRVMGDGCYSISRRLGRVFNSGCDLTMITHEASRFTAALESVGKLRPPTNDTQSYLSGVFFPEFHGKDRLQQVLNGEHAFYVPDARVLVEPNVRGKTLDLFDVFVDDMLVGSISPDGKMWRDNTPEQNALIVSLIGDTQ